MTDKRPHEFIADADFARRRAEAREKLDALDPAKQGRGFDDPLRRDWFKTVYALAEGDAAKVPWGNLSAHPLLAQWLEAPPHLEGLRALDIGSGLGDNAAALAGQGADVTAFDLVPAAVDWAKQRFPTLDFRAADLFAAPPDWARAFDFVNEIYTLQALPAEILPRARQAIAGFVKPGGLLLVISRARDEDQTLDGPPWPLCRADLMAFEDCGLRLERLDDIPPGVLASRHWLALFRKL
ncbi:SAM-dependent methyltransferase [Rhodoblastus sphagnicola]|uniref:SAM-dependent methyltransferase n=1 Tax=Rhodoblastus sphagnicola TaxID=333368 RepID=A0A2S6N645_9HYPH|nr:class I SAM-dependent methyltransferase [Rhodoblastus sphagnicola]MBB4196345.1 SAM-dependent methyltransferase [Rhodoblastus sphagnicola]PPQ30095.1 SAM-dependent methyltransferase [Rhodoblastus sphagnicola]